jgi:hypothetical protein
MTSETKQQEAPKAAEPQREHEWLRKLAGEWTFEAEASMGPDQPPMKSSGRESVRPFGDLWILCEGRGEMPGVSGEHKSILTLGYDPQKKRFVGSFISSMMNHLWVYDGALEGNTLTLDCEGPNMMQDGGTSKYQDVIELASDDHRIMRSRIMGDDGQWQDFMTSHYRRTR